ncbi:N-acetylglucosamine-6-phosphate deacetylase [Fusibacter ferrireducens]|uniref:N-acetylglucosamine-6-phosphate deacetylase n=1 Tax=Fusibacter ferrireducens TaxID=2785058 RepID=A0ABR9ZRS8_9FIRM|nr:N-acetylglucosamine-6-phosphate deacetylase [Fusibacter ferrireducens]MBF4693163.1 N-acetylglucosamine-6-phosphate deacetylase [Fusibacter ferrireducens]
MKAIINAQILLEDQIIEEGYLLFDEKIRGYGCISDFEETLSRLELSRDTVEIIEGEGRFVGPGFIDIHIHGAGGSDTMDGTQEALEIISTTVLKSGVTRFLATTMTMASDEIRAALEAIRERVKRQKNQKTAQILGVHLEGPFINVAKKGAQNGQYVVPPDFEWVKPYLDLIKIITIAPENDAHFEFIEQMKAYPKVKLSIGHTNSNFETAMSAFENGVTHITHCFNAMPSLHHREPGVIGALMSEPFTAELIADGIHVHKGLFKGLIKCVDKDKLVLITDSMRAGGLEEGQYDLGGQNVIVKEGACRLEDGTLAGSVLTMNQAARNFARHTELPLNEIVNLVSLNPAKVIGMDTDYGSLGIGKVADINIFDEHFNITRTFVDGF